MYITTSLLAFHYSVYIIITEGIIFTSPETYIGKGKMRAFELGVSMEEIFKYSSTGPIELF